MRVLLKFLISKIWGRVSMHPGDANIPSSQEHEAAKKWEILCLCWGWSGVEGGPGCGVGAGVGLGVWVKQGVGLRQG